jgi:hypothetical protein
MWCCGCGQAVRLLVQMWSGVTHSQCGDLYLALVKHLVTCFRTTVSLFARPRHHRQPMGGPCLPD